MHFHAAMSTRDGWHVRGLGKRDAVAVILLLALLMVFGSGVRQMFAPFSVAHQSEISLSPLLLPVYALRSVMRMMWAMAASVLFTFLYATLAAKSRRAEMALIPLLDALQSVPVLGFLSFTTVFFLSLFPGNVFGAELAAIFAIFTSQAWNMTFSFYQSLRMVPADLDEAARSFRFSAWQRFWRLEVPFAMPGLVWNMMMSMSAGWFFVVASEFISVGALHISLPGIGSYVAAAMSKRDLAAVGWAIAAMGVTILLYDQLLFRPMVAWAEKFRFEQTGSALAPKSWVLDILCKSKLILGGRRLRTVGHRLARARFELPRHFLRIPHLSISQRTGDTVWAIVLAASCLFGLWHLMQFVTPELSVRDIASVAGYGLLTFVRVMALIILASVIWVPIGVAVGMRPALVQVVQPVAQFFAAFPANLMFPVAVSLIVRYHANPQFWLLPLMIMGTQWYILFNVIAGVSAFPGDLLEASRCFRIRGRHWWSKVMLPGILPYYVTGAITASGGAWNASIVSEFISWGQIRLDGSGLGSYIARMTEAGDYPRITLGVVVMSVFVVSTNRLLWRPLYAFAERRARLE